MDLFSIWKERKNPLQFPPKVQPWSSKYKYHLKEIIQITFQIYKQSASFKICACVSFNYPSRTIFWKTSYGSMLMYGFCSSWINWNVPTCKFHPPIDIMQNLLSNINKSL